MINTSKNNKDILIFAGKKVGLESLKVLIDDDRNKKGLFMPGSGLPIYSSDKIISEKIDVCFTAMSYENEQKVRKKNQGFIIDGGQLVSISPNAEQNIYNFFS